MVLLMLCAPEKAKTHWSNEYTCSFDPIPGFARKQTKLLSDLTAASRLHSRCCGHARGGSEHGLSRLPEVVVRGSNEKIQDMKRAAEVLQRLAFT